MRVQIHNPEESSHAVQNSHHAIVVKHPSVQNPQKAVRIAQKYLSHLKNRLQDHKNPKAMKKFNTDAQNSLKSSGKNKMFHIFTKTQKKSPEKSSRDIRILIRHYKNILNDKKHNNLAYDRPRGLPLNS